MTELEGTRPSAPETELSQWERAALTAWGNYITAREKQALTRAVALAGAPGLMLDNGCGEGRWTEFVLRHGGWKAVCLDIDPVALEKCRQRNPAATCVLVTERDRTLPVADGSAGLILCVEVPGLLESAWFQAEVSRVLRPGGLLVGIFHNRNSFRGWYRAASDGLRREFCFYRMSFGTWRRKMHDLGLEIAEATGLCWFPFRRTSNSRWVPVFTRLEILLGLRRLPAFSPWVLFTARKTSERIGP